MPTLPRLLDLLYTFLATLYNGKVFEYLSRSKPSSYTSRLNLTNPVCMTKYKIVRATCSSDRSSEVRVVELEFICRTLHAFTVARHTELSKRDIYPFVCSGA